MDLELTPVILIVEDEWLIRDVLAAEFRRAGWTVLEASSGEGALGLIESDEPVDALVTDIQLGGRVSGWDVADAFHERHHGEPVIYTSGNAAERDRLIPGSIFVPKPCSPPDVVAMCGRRASAPRRVSVAPF